MGLLSWSKRGDYVDGETPLMSAGQAKSVLKTIQSYFPKQNSKFAKSLKGNLLDPESKEILATGEEVNSEGFVLNEMGDQTPVYLVPENLTKEYLGDDVNSAVDRMVEVAFHGTLDTTDSEGCSMQENSILKKESFLAHATINL